MNPDDMLAEWERLAPGRLSIDLSVRTTQVSVRYALIPVDEP